MSNVDRITRYNAACTELCTRISVRNNTLLHFTAFSAGVFALALRGGSEISIIGVSIPYLSLFVVLISSYHERIMYKLMEYQAALVGCEDDSIPNWYSDDFYGSLISTRTIRDWAQVYTIVPISLAALLLIYSRWDTYEAQYRTSYLWAVVIACIALAIAVVVQVRGILKKRQSEITTMNYCKNRVRSDQKVLSGN